MPLGKFVRAKEMKEKKKENFLSWGMWYFPQASKPTGYARIK